MKNIKILWCPVSTLRAGLIIDSNGSSYPIFKRMIERLSAMILPNWAYNMIAPVSMDDVIDKLAMLVERSPKEMKYLILQGLR